MQAQQLKYKTAGQDRREKRKWKRKQESSWTEAIFPRKKQKRGTQKPSKI